MMLLLKMLLDLKLNYTFFEQKYSNILDSIKSKQKIDDDTEAELKAALEEFKTVFSAN